MNGGAWIGFADAMDRVDASGSERYARMLERPGVSLGLYAPREGDPQQPHTRDELYLVVEGSGRLRCGGDARAFARGDALFVPAGVAHRFEDFSADLAVWVVFYGPAGGTPTG